jgi:hypothetical protein
VKGRERIALKSPTFGDEIRFWAVRWGSFFEISRRQASRIPKDRGIRMQAKDHKITGEMLPVIIGDCR